METNNITLNGTLKDEDIAIPVEIHYASRFSIFVKFGNSQNIKDGREFTSLSVQIDGVVIDLGKCRFLLETNIYGINGRLIFINDVYNFDIMFNKKDIVNLERLSKDLNLILLQKDRVKPQFRDYISRLTFDLKVYKNFFDELDKTLEAESEPVKSHVLQTIINTEGRKFMKFFAGCLDELEKIIADFTREEHELHGFYLRKQLWDIILCSKFMLRVNIKPRGYVGDSETMRMIYENEYEGDTTFAKILYKYSMEHPAAEAVRNRRLMVPSVLREIKNDFCKNNEGIFRFLSVACGPAYELHDIFKSEDDVKSMHCTLLDQDNEALMEAAGNIQEIEKRIGYKINAAYLRDSVRTMLREKDLAAKWGQFHYIYSMGLFDYLTPPVAMAVIEKMYSLLQPGGKLFIGNFHFRNRSRWFMEYWHDWVLYYRTEEDFISLLKNTDASDIKITFEDTKSQMFMTATRP